MTNDEFWREIEKARQLVLSWPEWKRGILEQSSSPTVRTPRPVIVSAEHDSNRATTKDNQ